MLVFRWETHDDNNHVESVCQTLSDGAAGKYASARRGVNMGANGCRLDWQCAATCRHTVESQARLTADAFLGQSLARLSWMLGYDPAMARVKFESNLSQTYVTTSNYLTLAQ